jgi:hypothetical protein
MSKYTVRVFDLNTSGGYSYSIDSPTVSTIELGEEVFIAFRCWVLSKYPDPFELVFSHIHGCRYKTNVNRQDVVDAFPNAQLQCGLDCVVPLQDEFEFGVLQGKDYCPLAKLSFEKLMVLEGSSGYLFLDNDDNGSVDQFLGNKSISDEDIAGWKHSFNKLEHESTERDFSYVFCIAPAKEYVLTEHYPFLRSNVSPQDQFLLEFGRCHNILNPIQELALQKNLSYSKNDTHWTDYGASLVSELICNYFNVPYIAPPFEYRPEVVCGDLGIKYNPQRIEVCFVAKKEKPELNFFDNAIEVRGNILVIENEKAEKDETCLIFGSSSSESVAKYLSFTFRRVVRIFSGADIDYDIIRHERPAFVVIIFASRFLIRAPEKEFYLCDEIARKLEMLSPDKRLDLLSENDFSNSSGKNAYYQYLLNDALSRLTDA